MVIPEVILDTGGESPRCSRCGRTTFVTCKNCKTEHPICLDCLERHRDEMGFKD